MTLTHRQAQQLKDAGFPQNKTEYILRKYSLAEKPIKLVRPPKGTEISVLSGKLEWELALPTLPELIKECGDKFGALNALGDLGGEDKITSWSAENGGKLIDSNILPLKCTGKTPEEAVKKLWIKLNK